MSEKMIHGDYRTAFRYLQQAARSMSEKGDTFYHLAFLAENMTLGKKNGSGFAFYAKEAIERKVDNDKEIKIWCLLGKAYNELGFKKDAARCFNQSKKLDRDDDFAYFRLKYSKSTSEQASFTRLSQADYRNKQAEQDALIEKSRRGNCYVLEINRHGKILHGNGASMVLNNPQAELLRLFFEWKEGLNKFDIINNTTSIRSNRSPEAVKAQISRLRGELKKELEVEGKDLIKTVGVREEQKYIWNPNIECHIVEKI